MQQTNDTQQVQVNGKTETFLACLYDPAGTAFGTIGDYRVQFTMHAPPDTGIHTALAAALADDEKDFGLQVGSTKTTTSGATLHLFLTPDLGPGTYATYLGITAGGEEDASCTVEVLGPNGYVMDINASAKRAVDYDGSLAEATQCGWAEGAVRLAMGP